MIYGVCAGDFNSAMRWAAAWILALTVTSACATDSKYRGRFYWGPEVQVFEPCAEVKSFWVKADQKTLQPLINRSEQLRLKHGKPYRPLYVELIGSVDIKSKREGFAADYDGILHVRKLVRTSDSIPKRCRE